MKAVILAAGRSTRLYPVTEHIPKCLLEVGGRTLLEYQLDAISSAGVHEVIIVTGCQSELILQRIEEVGPSYPFSILTAYNDRFADTNNLYSLWIARDHWLDESFWCFHADVLFSPEILKLDPPSSDDICLLADRRILEETMKLRTEGDRVVAVGKHVTKREATGTFLGIARFSENGGRRVMAEVDTLVRANETNVYFTKAIEKVIECGDAVTASFTDGLPWIEIDFLDELDEARREVLPQILATRSRPVGLI